MREAAGSAAAPAARCRNRRRGSFIAHPPVPAASLDHLIGQRKQLVRDFEAERLRGLEIDYQLELCRQHNRQITGLLAFEDASGINASLTPCIGKAGPV